METTEYIPRAVIDEIRERDLVSILRGEGLELKANGANYVCRCPFHDEKTPSFVVSPRMNIATCFGEGRSWDAIGFVMEYCGMQFYEAVEYLAGKLDIQYEKRELTPEERKAKFEREQLIAVNNEAQKWFRESYEKSPGAKEYCKTRDWNDNTVKTFGVGYAPKSGGLCKYLTEKGWKRDVLVTAGLVVLNDDGQYFDSFRERIMFPIYSKQG